MAKKSTNNTLKRLATIISITIGSIVLLGAVGGIFVERYQNQETREVVGELEPRVTEVEKTQIKVLEKMENIDEKVEAQSKSMERIERKLDRALGR